MSDLSTIYTPIINVVYALIYRHGGGGARWVTILEESRGDEAKREITCPMIGRMASPLTASLATVGLLSCIVTHGAI